MSHCSPDTVQEAFLTGAPLVSQNIIDLTIQHPNFLRDLPAYEEFPLGSGAVMEQLIFRGSLPKVERGMDAWKKIKNITGCDPCEGPDCSYNWTQLGGHSFDKKLTELMTRDFKSAPYCVNEIQTTKDFREVFAKIVENLYRQIDFFKEINIAQNFITGIAKKFVVDSQGPKINTANPYTYPNIGLAEISALNMDMLEFFYERMRYMTDVLPYDVVNGRPLFAIQASDQLLSRLFRDDEKLREDVRFSSAANDNLYKYNFMYTIRGMFLPVSTQWPRRFNIVNGEPMEVLPFINGVPAEAGSYTDHNAAYDAATHEEILLHGKYPFKVMYLPTTTTLGANTSFGPEFAFMNSWAWINNQTDCDPFRRVGFFATSAKIGISQQYSEGVFGVLVTRPPVNLMAKYQPSAVCPPNGLGCDNVIPETNCPCPLVLSYTLNRFSGFYEIEFATPVAGELESTITFDIANGGTLEGTLEGLTDDGLYGQVSFPDGTVLPSCNEIVGISCEDNSKCSSPVICASDCRAGETGSVKLQLKWAIRAEVGENIVACFCDGTTATLTIAAVNLSTLEYSVGYAAGFGPTDNPTGAGAPTPGELNAGMVCDRLGIAKVCVPPTTDASCPSCDAPELTPCVEPEV